jgi:hypothetical protein
MEKTSGMNLASDFSLMEVLERNLVFLILQILARNNLVILILVVQMSDVMVVVLELAREEQIAMHPLGNVLIIQERNKRLDILDDNFKGGMINFDFTSASNYVYNIGLLDVDYKDYKMTIRITYKMM